MEFNREQGELTLNEDDLREARAIMWSIQSGICQPWNNRFRNWRAKKRAQILEDQMTTRLKDYETERTSYNLPDEENVEPFSLSSPTDLYMIYQGARCRLDMMRESMRRKSPTILAEFINTLEPQLEISRDS